MNATLKQILFKKHDKKILIYILGISTALSLLLTFAGCTTVPTVTTKGIPNLYSVDGNIYRGGQPTDEGWVYLKSIGVTNVIKLNEKSEGSDQKAIDLGMNVVYHPINIADQVYFKPNKKAEFDAVAHITPFTYVHCEHGQDRTGLTIGIYRVQHDGWTKEKAYNEMIAHGFHKSLHGLDDFWEDDVK